MRPVNFKDKLSPKWPWIFVVSFMENPSENPPNIGKN
jgi:hypothetical protein